MLIYKNERWKVVCVAVTLFAVMLFGNAAWSANLCANGDMESWTNGLPDLWRYFAVNDAVGSVSQTSAAGTFTSGNSGAILSWTNNNVGDSGLDKWDNPIPLWAGHAYRFLADVKLNSGESALRLGLAVQGANPYYETYSLWGDSLMTTKFQTVGMGVSTIPGDATLCPSFRLIGTGNASSVYIDNVKVDDVSTYGNRVINGDFENSDIYLTGWRFFNVGTTPADASASISPDAQSGLNAALLTVTTPPVAGDVGLDFWNNPIATIGNENLTVTFHAKKVSASSGAKLVCVVTELAWNYAGIADHEFSVNPSISSYTTYTNTITTRLDTCFVDVSFRIKDDSGNIQPGSYLIDNLYAGSATNLLPDGDMETWTRGANNAPDYWRWYTAGGASGLLTQTTTPGTFTSGSSGALIAWNNNTGDSALDMWSNKNAAVAQHIYRLSVDAKHQSGESALKTGLIACLDESGKWQLVKDWGSVLTSDFQTFASEVRMTDTEDQLCARIDVSNGGTGSAAYVDNAKLEDVTFGNRMFNGDFENSSSQLLQWRFFNVGGGSALATLSSNAASGSKAAQLTVTSLPASGDIGLDTWADAIIALPNEPLQVSFSSKKLSGASDTGITCEILVSDATGAIIRRLVYFVAPSDASYSNFAFTTTLPDNASYTRVGYRITDRMGNLRTGSYLIDKVSLGASLVADTALSSVSIGDLKKLPNGSVFSVNGSVVSRVVNSNTLYIETDDRTSGVRVQKLTHGISDDGVRVNVSGFVWTDANGERYIDASSVQLAGSGSVEPLGMTNKVLPGGVGLDTTGLLVRTWGKIVDIDSAATPTWFTIDDGSGIIVKCSISAEITIDPNWTYVAVTGISSRVKNGTVVGPDIFVAKQSDITPE